MPHLPRGFLACGGVSPADLLQNSRLSFERADFSLRHHFYILKRGDAVDEITRHALRQVGTADEQPDLRDFTGQIHHRLTRGVAAADERHLLTLAEPRLYR